MNVIYNICKGEDLSSLHEYSISIRFSTQDDQFIGEVKIIIRAKNKEKASVVAMRLRQSLVNEYKFKIISNTGIIELVNTDLKLIAMRDVNAAFDPRDRGNIMFETYIGDFRVSEYMNLGMPVSPQSLSGAGKIIMQELEFIIINENKNYFRYLGELRVEIDRSFKIITLEEIILLYFQIQRKLKYKLRKGDTIPE